MENHEIFISVIAGVLLMLFLAIVFIMSVVRYNKRLNAHRLEKQNLRSEFQQTLLQTQLEIQEQTFKNISQEIHDNIGQVLSLVKLNINTMDGKDPAALANKINDSKHLISKAIQDLRDLSKSINTDYVNELGLVGSIEYELELLKRTGDYEIQFNIGGNAYRLEQQQELILFRIFQEGLHNILKHAKATLVEVKLTFEPEAFILHIIDNGAGFDSSQLQAGNNNKRGLGIRNMQNRASMIQADLQVTSALQKGTALTLTLPLQTPKL